MAKTKRKVKKASKGRKAATRVAKKKPQKVSWLAKGYPWSPAITVLDDCARAIDWYKKVLGAKQRLRLDMPGRSGRALRARVRRRGSDDGQPDAASIPAEDGESGRSTSRTVMRPTREAIGAGARSMQEPADQFYGDRQARFEDPFGRQWSVMTHVKNVSEKEMKKAMAQMGNPG